MLRTLTAPCRVCGCRDVRIDSVRVADHPATSLVLGECPRCDDRWTQPVERVALRALAVPIGRSPHTEAVSNAA